MRTGVIAKPVKSLLALVLAGLGVFSSPSLSAYSYFICLMAGLCHRGYATGDPDGVDPDGPWGQEA